MEVYLKRTHVSLTILLLILWFHFACSSSNYKQAVEFRETGRQEQGIAFFRERLKNESNALALFDVHRLILQYHNDLDRLEEGVALYSGFRDFALTNYIHGLRAQHYGLHTQAVSNFRAALTKRPKEYAIWYDLAVSYMRLGPRFYREARGALAQVYKRKKDFAPALHDMALMYGYGWGGPETGMAWMSEAVRSYYPVERTAIVDAKITLALFAEKSGDYRRARDVYRTLGDDSFEKVIRTGDPGEAFFRTGDRSRALDIWQRALDTLGYQSPRGRHFFKKLYGARQGIVDFTGVKYHYSTVESLQEITPRFVFASESEPYYETNQRFTRVSFDRLQSDGLSDLRMGNETWIVQYRGVMTRPMPVRRLLHNRGIARSLQTRDGLSVLVSLQKSRFPVRLPHRHYAGRMQSVDFWREGNPIVGIYRGEEQVARIQLPFVHFHDLVLQDVNGDGLEDIVACGFDAAGNLVLTVHLRTASGWHLFTQQTCDLTNPNNGFVLLDLDGRPGLEMVRFSTATSWADVFQHTANGFVINHHIFPKFAEDFAWRYSFLDQAQINQRMNSPRPSPEEKAALPLLLPQRQVAEGILRSLPR
jgi:tetratricopeptide (TPR) repeat protein